MTEKELERVIETEIDLQLAERLASRCGAGLPGRCGAYRRRATLLHLAAATVAVAFAALASSAATGQPLYGGLAGAMDIEAASTIINNSLD